jgi:hypothetical protein
VENKEDGFVDEKRVEVPEPKKRGRPCSKEKKDIDFRCRLSGARFLKLEKLVALMQGNKSAFVRKAIEDYVEKLTVANTAYNLSDPQRIAIAYLQKHQLTPVQLRLIEFIINENDKDRLLTLMQIELGRKMI